MTIEIMLTDGEVKAIIEEYILKSLSLEDSDYKLIESYPTLGRYTLGVKDEITKLD